jgi:hypothetical protein
MKLSFFHNYMNALKSVRTLGVKAHEGIQIQRDSLLTSAIQASRSGYFTTVKSGPGTYWTKGRSGRFRKLTNLFPPIGIRTPDRPARSLITILIIHYTLYIIHHTLYNIHYTLYTIHHTLYTIHYTLYTIHYTLYTVHHTLYTIHHTLYTIHNTLHTIHHTLYTIHYTP